MRDPEHGSDFTTLWPFSRFPKIRSDIHERTSGLFDMDVPPNLFEHKFTEFKVDLAPSNFFGKTPLPP
jgi:hypothetical protein